VVECRICNWEVAGSHLSLGYFAPRSTQPSIPLGSVNEYQLRLGRQRQVWFIPIADERVGVQVKLRDPLRTRAILERFCGGDSLRRGARPISSVWTFNPERSRIHAHIRLLPNGLIFSVCHGYPRGLLDLKRPLEISGARFLHRVFVCDVSALTLWLVG